MQYKFLLNPGGNSLVKIMTNITHKGNTRHQICVSIFQICQVLRAVLLRIQIFADVLVCH